jgi:hypothetical protein
MTIDIDICLFSEDNRGRSESIMSTAELDLNDLERSLAEVKENLL